MHFLMMLSGENSLAPFNTEANHLKLAIDLAPDTIFVTITVQANPSSVYETFQFKGAGLIFRQRFVLPKIYLDNLFIGGSGLGC